MSTRTWVTCPLCGEPDMYRESGVITCTNLVCPSNGGQENVDGAYDIDWRARYQQAHTDNIRAADRHRKRLGAVQLELDQARREIAELREQVRDLQPAGSRLQAAIQEQQRLTARYNEAIRGLHRELARLHGIIQDGRAEVVRKLIAELNETLPADKKVTPS